MKSGEVEEKCRRVKTVGCLMKGMKSMKGHFLGNPLRRDEGKEERKKLSKKKEGGGGKECEGPAYSE